LSYKAKLKQTDKRTSTCWYCGWYRYD